MQASAVRFANLGGGDLEYSIMIRADTDHTLENHQERDLKCSHLVHLYNGTLLGH